MYKYIFTTTILFAQLFSKYNVGDEISTEHQNKEFDVCYGDYPTEKFKLSDFQNKVIRLYFAATW